MPEYQTVDNESCFEGVTPKWSLTIRDHEDAVLGSGSLSTLTLTYTNFESGTVINSRNGQNVLNANNCTLSAGGEFVWNIREEDTTISDATTPVGTMERRDAILKWTWTDANAVTQIGKAKLVLSVVNL